MQGLFVDKIHFFKFLSMSDKLRLHQLKIVTSTRSTVQVSLTTSMFPSVRGNTIKEGEILMLRRNAKPRQLIKHTGISYSIVSLVFRKFSCGTSRNVLNQVPQSWGTLSTSKSMNRVSPISLSGNPRFSMLLHRVQYLKNLLCLEDNRSSFSRVSLKSEAKDARPCVHKRPFSSVCEGQDEQFYV